MSEKKITEQDFVNALKDMNTYMDISVDDLMIINQKANQHARFRLSLETPVEKFMTQPVTTISPDSSIAKAAELMLEKQIAGLPVVDDNNNLVGIFTEADLLTAVGVPRNNPPQSVWSRLEAIFSYAPGQGDFNSLVSDLMNRDVIVIHKENTLGEVLNKMKTANVNRLVVTEDRSIVGMVTRSNLLRVFLEQLSRQPE